MAYNYGKKFELKFKEDWKKSFSESFLHRLPDQVSGYITTSQNPCDFIGYIYPILFLIECKSVKGNTFPFSNLKQYERLLPYINFKGIAAGVVVWFQEHNKVVWVDISEIKKMKEDNKKSINILKSKEEGYSIIEIPSTKKRVFLDSDYSILYNVYYCRC